MVKLKGEKGELNSREEKGDVHGTAGELAADERLNFAIRLEIDGGSGYV